MKLSTMIAGAALLSLGACAVPPSHNMPTNAAATPSAGTPPVSNAGANSSGVPQSPNSLPAGARVNAPITPSTGAVGTTRVGPAR